MIFQDPVMFVYKWDPSCLEMCSKKKPPKKQHFLPVGPYSSWYSSIIVQVFKKDDSTGPYNYRGISLVSNMCKFFTSILNKGYWNCRNTIML